MSVLINDIEEVIKEKGFEFVEDSSVLATIKASVGAYANGLGSEMSENKKHVIHFNGDGIIIVALLEGSNGKVSKVVEIENTVIKKIEVEKALVDYRLTISTDHGDVIYKIANHNIRYKWQKANFNRLFESLI